MREKRGRSWLVGLPDKWFWGRSTCHGLRLSRLVFLDKSFQEYLKLGRDPGGQFVGALLGQKVVAHAVHFKHCVLGGDQL